MIKEVSAREFIFYIAHRAPVANPDRDVVLRATIEPFEKNHARDVKNDAR
jgi:hypothetical protein